MPLINDITERVNGWLLMQVHLSKQVGAKVLRIFHWKKCNQWMG